MSVARRYAKALFALAKDANALEPTGEQLERVAAVVHDPSVGSVVASPLLTSSKRTEMARMLGRELGLSELLTRFVVVLAEQKRLVELPMIRLNYDRLLDAALNRARAIIRSNSALSPQQQAELISTFTRLTGKQVMAQVVVDPGLLGGVVVEVEGKVYDGSVRNQLDRLAAQLTGSTQH
ncbi:MAG TPA: ATP synthase F1 subunit delta [Candidatus Acidoferrales bacterium]|nr:ATP synthase F1 subunit delta [Candidatus Acidoferrales bacterium]